MDVQLQPATCTRVCNGSHWRLRDHALLRLQCVCTFLVGTGMSAARQLRNWGYQVVVLEGRNRPGGRVYTKRLQVRISTHQARTAQRSHPSDIITHAAQQSV